MSGLDVYVLLAALVLILSDRGGDFGGGDVLHACVQPLVGALLQPGFGCEDVVHAGVDRAAVVAHDEFCFSD